VWRLSYVAPDLLAVVAEPEPLIAIAAPRSSK
jgi:hypothetical protein